MRARWITVLAAACLGCGAAPDATPSSLPDPEEGRVTIVIEARHPPGWWIESVVVRLGSEDIARAEAWKEGDASVPAVEEGEDRVLFSGALPSGDTEIRAILVLVDPGGARREIAGTLSIEIPPRELGLAIRMDWDKDDPGADPGISVVKVPLDVLLPDAGQCIEEPEVQVPAGDDC